MKWGVVVFPGSNCDADCVDVLRSVLRQDVTALWHQSTSLAGCGAIVLPGGFSYGDYLRTGAVAKFSPIMRAVSSFARDGGLILGICNGFQILLESGLLPGAMLPNTGLRFRCKEVTLRVERADTVFTNQFRQGQVVRMPIAHYEGRYTAPAGPLGRIREHALFRYCDESGAPTDAANPNGSTDHIAGLMNGAGNVMGMMPHPERAAEPALGSGDGRLIFESMLQAVGVA
ncbi:MAG TPA: phosphoribosylformylglycinamidine synthase subunit PurQ [bacterium]